MAPIILSLIMTTCDENALIIKDGGNIKDGSGRLFDCKKKSRLWPGDFFPDGIYHEYQKERNETIYSPVPFSLFYIKNIKDASIRNQKKEEK